MKIETAVGIEIAQFLPFFESVMRALPNDVICVSPIDTRGGAVTIRDAVDPQTPMAGSPDVYISTSSLTAQDTTDLFTTPLAQSDNLTSTKVGSKWEVVSTRLVPTNLAENLSGQSTRTTVKGIGEIVSSLIAGDGVGTQAITGFIIDQPNGKAALFSGDAASTFQGPGLCVFKARFSGIIAASQGFLEGA